jgi:arylsulfatase A-like enzyme
MLAVALLTPGLLLAGSGRAGGGRAEALQRPSIVLILTDDQRADATSLMPSLQRELVQRGVVLSSAVVSTPLCCPSRATLLTGRYAHRHGTYRNTGPHGGVASFQDDETLPVWLDRAGYATAFVGKYLNGYRGRRVPPGWDRWRAFSWGWGYFGYRLVDERGRLRHFGYAPEDYSTDVLAREAVKLLRRLRPPFFLLFAPAAPHEPALPAPRDRDRLAELPPHAPPSLDEEDVSDKPSYVQAQPRLGPRLRQAAARYREAQLESLLSVDRALHAILAALRRRDLLERTVVIYTSDNGVMWGEHRLRAGVKAVPYEEAIRVPLIIRWDALLVTPRSEPALVANVDLAPTIADLAGVPMPRADGRSLLPLLLGGRWAPREIVLEYLHAPRWKIPSYCGLRGERYKYVLYETGEEELYDLRSDPYELQNLASSERYARLRALLRERTARACSPPPPGFPQVDLPVPPPASAGKGSPGRPAPAALS